MPTVTVQSIVDRAGVVLHDPTHVSWPIAELVGWVNDASREVVLAKPEAFTKTEIVPLVAGTRQVIPSDGVRILDVFRNATTTVTSVSTFSAGPTIISPSAPFTAIAWYGSNPNAYYGIVFPNSAEITVYDENSAFQSNKVYYNDLGGHEVVDATANAITGDYHWFLTNTGTPAIHVYNGSDYNHSLSRSIPLTGIVGTPVSITMANVTGQNSTDGEVFVATTANRVYKVNVNTDTITDYFQYDFGFVPDMFTFDGTYFVIASGQSNSGLLHRFTRDGVYVDTFNHPYGSDLTGLTYNYAKGVFVAALGNLQQVREFDILDTTITIPDAPQNAIRAVSRDVLDAQYPDWHYVNPYPDSQVRHVVYDGRTPREFYVHPVQDGSNKVHICYSAAPPKVTINDVIPIDDIYANAILDYVLFRAYEKDADYSKDAPQANHFKELFFSSLQAKAQTDMAYAPSKNTTQRFPDASGGIR